MSKTNKNPYKTGNYAKLFAFLWNETKKNHGKGYTTRQSLTQFAISKLGMTESAAGHTLQVLLSPRETNSRGDCRGSFSAHGEVYFLEPLAKKDGEDRRYRLCWRKTALESRIRPKAKAKKKAKKKMTSILVKTKKVKSVEKSVEATA